MKIGLRFRRAEDGGLHLSSGQPHILIPLYGQITFIYFSCSISWLQEQSKFVPRLLLLLLPFPESVSVSAPSCGMFLVPGQTAQIPKRMVRLRLCGLAFVFRAFPMPGVSPKFRSIDSCDKAIMCTQYS
jgi:hypothetical protein